MRRTILMAAVVVSTFGLWTVGWTPPTHAQDGSDSGGATGEASTSGDAEKEPEQGAKQTASSEGGAEDETAETDTGSSKSSDDEESPGISRFGGGSFDMMASLGLGSFLYPILELGVDIGVVPVSDRVTVSFGATGAAGVCLLCAGITALSGFNVSAWNVSPQGRVAVHYDLKPELGAALDSYLAFSTGPDFYFARVSSSGATVTGTVFSWAFVPILGGRYFPSAPKNFFAFGEFRWLTEFSVSGGRFSNEAWNRDITWTGSGYTRRGFDFILGGGLRF